MKFIKLTTGLVTRVSDEDFERLNAFRWFLSDRQYVARTIWDPKSKTLTKVLMHREILSPEPGEFVDHVDGDSLNNQRENLRSADRSLNGQNKPSKHGSTSQYLGVCWVPRDRVWRAQFNFHRHTVHVGDFKSEVAAAIAYDAAVVAKRGTRVVRLNFPDLAPQAAEIAQALSEAA